MSEVKTTLRYAPGIHREVAELALREQRSINAQLVWLITRALEAERRRRQKDRAS